MWDQYSLGAHDTSQNRSYMMYAKVDLPTAEQHQGNTARDRNPPSIDFKLRFVTVRDAVIQLHFASTRNTKRATLRLRFFP
jgi:hypothetical protein